ncbi:MAG: hypothetical protein A3A73_02875 [Omnitrophica bacterium RIFCSPLOWO2_01_FULL_50_24]|nr:MAG: hypothetical protein A3A73_02875 [Omnitrophica bacterium RIFCSPLOWO2_01_FULL_50_24]
MNEKEITAAPSDAGLRLDFFLAQKLGGELSRTKLKKLIAEGSVTINAKTVKPHAHVEAGDRIKIRYSEDPEETHRGEPIPFEVAYEDADVIVVNKPAGLVVHPASGNLAGTLVNALIHYTSALSQGSGPGRPGIVHRIDKDTSGLVVVAKNDRAHRILARQFERHEVEKCYWAVVKGVVQHDEMRSSEPLGRSPLNRKRVVVSHDSGKPSLTDFRVLKRFKTATLLEARPKTGKTHQIRVHLERLGYPVLGDLVYGVQSPHISRQALHAKELGFRHPTTGERLLFRSELPPDFQHLLTALV